MLQFVYYTIFSLVLRTNQRLTAKRRHKRIEKVAETTKEKTQRPIIFL